ncbi:MAG: hypothetical protein FD145_743 [Candidatus Saganbacteria bacterium]|uniref:DUF86 domain-containing protein n=1 Tax=Candidatus Saganbacteria bacterium TaxID=2575572 RepID=A0A833NYM7_UNCSA|nr:MAG: hypothetical protein FD145_743 [Candidatus Saganbacteria bacterium]
MIDIELIRRKLARLNMYLDKLGPMTKYTFNEYLSDTFLKYSTERLVQLIVECATDINGHVVVELKGRPPEDYTSSFIRASDVGLINFELANRLKASGGMRNLLVHEYMEIDDKKVYETIPVCINDYKEYIKQVEKFIKNNEIINF